MIWHARETIRDTTPEAQYKAPLDFLVAMSFCDSDSVSEPIQRE
jgi:hypothetical protein